MCNTQPGEPARFPLILKKYLVLTVCSDPWVTAVGGTVIGNVNATIDSSGNFNNGTFDEYVWSDVNTTSPFTSIIPFGATGGGVSALFDRPSYQSALIVKDSTGKTLSGRAIPDIAGMVGGSGYVINSSTGGFIGTSVTTPMYAGLFAVYRSAFGQKFGPLNSYLYTIGTTFPKAYKDVITGDNDSGDATPYFTAGPGWDAASGWGSINGQSMEDALAHLLYPKNFYVTVRKNSFGLDEGS
jgi:kumamolisin